VEDETPKGDGFPHKLATAETSAAAHLASEHGWEKYAEQLLGVITLRFVGVKHPPFGGFQFCVPEAHSSDRAMFRHLGVNVDLNCFGDVVEVA
jgi:hypothetical protein